MWEFDKLELVILGDSFAHGACVRNEDSFVGRLRQQYPKTINLAYNGNGPVAELASLKEFVAGRKADKILWFYFGGNDFLGARLEASHPILDKYLRERSYTQNLANNQFAVDEYLQSVFRFEFTRTKLQRDQKLAIPSENSKKAEPAVWLSNLKYLRAIISRIILTDFERLLRKAIERSVPGLVGAGHQPVNQASDVDSVMAAISKTFHRAKEIACQMEAKIVFILIPHQGAFEGRGVLPESELVLKMAKKTGFSVIDRRQKQIIDYYRTLQ